MATPLWFRIFRAGRFNADTRSAAANPRALLAREGVSVRAAATHLVVPGRRAGRPMRVRAGSVVLFEDRVLAAVGPTTLADATLRGERDPTATRVTVSPAGVVLTTDVGRMVPGASGTLSWRFRIDIDNTTMKRLPLRTGYVDLDPAVLGALL